MLQCLNNVTIYHRTWCISFVLSLQGALTSDEKLTAIGHMLAQLPVDVVVGKMLVMATIFHVSLPLSPALFL